MALGPSASSPPEPVDRWFASIGAEETANILSADPDWRSDVFGQGSQLTLGAPVALWQIDAGDYPAVDLTSRPKADVKLDVTAARSLVRDSDTWCGRVFVDNLPRDAMVCARTNGTAVELERVTDMRLTDDAVDLPTSGIIVLAQGTFGVTPTTFIALDDVARANVPAGTAPVDVLVEALARRNAELDAIARISGPVAGGGPSLLGATTDEIVRWSARVEQGLNTPDDQAWQPPPGERGAPLISPASLVSGLAAIGLVTVGAAYLGLRRLRDGRAMRSSDRPEPSSD